MDDQKATRAKLGESHAGKPLGESFLDPARPGQDVVGFDCQVAGQLGHEPVPVPTGVPEPGHVFRGEHQHPVHAHHHPGRDACSQALGQRPDQRIGRPTLLVDQDPGCLTAEGRHHILGPVEATILGQGGPRTARLVLGEAEPQLGHTAVGGPVDAAGRPAADVADHQLNGPPDGGVGSVPLAEGIHAAVHPDSR